MSALEPEAAEPDRATVEKHVQGETERALRTMVRHALIRLPAKRIVQIVTEEANRVVR